MQTYKPIRSLTPLLSCLNVAWLQFKMLPEMAIYCLEKIKPVIYLNYLFIALNPNPTNLSSYERERERDHKDMEKQEERT